MKRFAFLILAAAVTVGCHRSATSTGPAKELPVVPVTVAPVEGRTIQRTISATGTLAGYEDVLLSPKVDGRILNAKPDIGDIALPGSVLLEIDPTDFKQSLAWEKQSFLADLAKLGLTEFPKGAFDVEAVPEVQRAEAARQNARKTYERVKSLPGASKAESDSAETEMKVAEANKKFSITQAQSTLAAALARKESAEMAEQKLRDTKLRVPEPFEWAPWASVVGPGYAPFRYTVAAKMASEGEMVRSFPGTNIYRLVIVNTLKLRLTVPEKHAPEVRVGQPVDLRTEAFADEIFKGVVTRVNPTIDDKSRTFQVEVAIPNTAGRLKVGGFARAQIIVGTAAATVIPPGALVIFAGVSKVFVVDGDKAKAISVEVGMRDKDWLEVIGEVKPGAKVLTSGFSQLFDGSPIRVRE